MEIQFVAFKTIVRREVVRFIRIWPQTLLPPVITQTLYFVIFGKFIGSRLGDVHGVSYMAFLVPGLVMMAVINNAFTNVVSSFFSSKFQRNIEEILISPVAEGVIIAGYVAGGTLRGIMVGTLVFLVSIFFARPRIYAWGVILIFVVLTSVVFSLAGLVNAVFAKKFDDISIFPTFVLTPLTYLGGVFYSIEDLPEFWQRVSLINPVLYMVNGFRFGFYGFSDVHVVSSVGVLMVFAMGLVMTSWILLRRGVGLRT
jgi:ABC-2 type transport system permease protein